MMTCAHILGLLDAGPFAGYPQAHLDAAWEHARQCPTCGPALQASDRLTVDLAALPQPAPPPDLAAAVIARIARIEIAPSEDLLPLPARAHDWSPLITVLGGLAVGVALALSTSPASDQHTWMEVLAAGLALYAAGLFAPLRGSRPQ